jgi:hypothetical protein
LILAAVILLVAFLDLAVGLEVCGIKIYMPLTAPLNSVKHLQVIQPTLEKAKSASVISFPRKGLFIFLVTTAHFPLSLLFVGY